MMSGFEGGYGVVGQLSSDLFLVWGSSRYSNKGPILALGFFSKSLTFLESIRSRIAFLRVLQPSVACPMI